ncbi:unnamed protein product [Adineta ricciae]|uniref:Uncharacterized protein n=1 Tax=Adineta ricciae TaxID=249248 RepID=A0A814YFN9_ADIRI|nr:unnamed protein product [Adineta ricciae]
MSSYFFQRIKNVAASANSSTMVPRYMQQRETTNGETTKKPEVVQELSDDELLTSVLKFEQTPEFKQIVKIEEQAKKTEEPKNNTSNIHPFFKRQNSSTSRSVSPPRPIHSAASSTALLQSIKRPKSDVPTSLPPSKKRPISNSDEEDIVALDAPTSSSSSTSSIVRPPVKKLPNSKPDFQTFAPKNESVSDRTKAVLRTFRARRERGENVALTQIVASEQLRLREQLMRKPKPPSTSVVEKPKKPDVPVKRKANELDSSAPKKVRTTEKAPKNAFEKLMQEMTDTMTRVTLTNTTTTNTTTISPSSSSSHTLVDLTVVKSSSSSISSTVPLQSTTNKEKKLKPRKIHNYDDYLIYILKWPVSLIDEIEIESNILYKDFLGENAYPIPLLELYSSFDEYEEITMPWLFEETFEEIKRSVKLNDHKLVGIEYDAVLAQVRLFNSGLYELKAQILQKRNPTIPNQRREMFTEDDLVVITILNQPVKKLFGLIRSGERIIDKARLHKTYHEHPDVKIRPPVWFCYEYYIRIFGHGFKIPDGSQIKIKAITSLTATLRRFKALASMRTCPLFEHLLSPSLTDDVFQITNTQHKLMEQNYLQAYNESQRNVISEAVSMMQDTKDDNQAKIYMCQGPPGTGKSQTITGIVRALLQPMLASSPTNEQSSPTLSSGGSRKKMKILICCPSNGGCNEIVRRLIDVFTRKATDETASKLPFKLIRCARGGAISQDIENVSLDTLAQKRLEEELNAGGENEAIGRNLANKEKQKKQLEQRIEAEKKRQTSTANNQASEELKDLELNLKEIKASILKLQQTCRKTMPEAARRQREREIKIELLQDSDICVSTLNYVGNSIFDSFTSLNIDQSSIKLDKTKKIPSSTTSSSSSIVSTLFNCLIIDEAGQCIEIDNYIPLRLGMNRIILVGDPEQLPATVLSRRALEAGLNQSLFERLYKLFKYDVNNPIRMLNIQYRMHDEICKFPSMHIYRSKLKTDKIINQKRKKFLLKPYMILDVVNSQEQLDPITQSYGNPPEAETVVCLVEFINSRAKVPFNQIGIITPYNYQVKLIQQKLTQHNLHQHKIEIGTVDAFQGRQKDVILLSCVRATQTTDSSTTTTGIGFVANRQRLNVSLTRAKYAMYILGHMASLNINEDWQKLITNAVERKAILELTSANQFDGLIKRQQEGQTRPMETMSTLRFMLTLRRTLLAARYCQTSLSSSLRVSKQCVSSFDVYLHNLIGIQQKNFFSSSTIVHAQHRNRGHSNVTGIAEEEDEEEKDDDEDEDQNEQDKIKQAIQQHNLPKGYRIIIRHIASLRLDLICSAGTGIGRSAIEDEFYGSKLRVNGEKSTKKAQQVKEGDVIDLVVSRTDGAKYNSKRIVVYKVFAEKSLKNKIKVCLIAWRNGIEVDGSQWS